MLRQCAMEMESEGSVVQKVSGLGTSEYGSGSTEVQELAEWVSAVEEVVHEELSHVGALPDPDDPDNQE